MEAEAINKKKKLAPKLRFREFNTEWLKKKLEEFIIEYKGGAPLTPKDFIKVSKYEVIPKKGITMGGQLILDIEEPTYCTESFFNTYQKSVVDNSFLITTLRDLVPSGPNIGFIVKNYSDKVFILAQGVYGIKIDQKKLSEIFLIQFSNTLSYRKLMQTIMVGSTQVHIRNSTFFGINLAIPTLSEQQKIAYFLSAVDEKTRQLTRKKELLGQYKKGVMQQLFSGKLRFKDENGKAFPKWEEKRLGDIANIRSGLTKNQIASDTGLKVTRIETISDGTINLDKVGFIETYDNIDDFKIKKGDILFSNINSVSHIGKTAIALSNLELYHGMNLLCLKCYKELDYLFLFYFLNTTGVRNHFKSVCNQAVSQASINQTQLAKTKIKLPHVKEQKSISAFIYFIDNSLEVVNKQITQTQTFKRGLLQQMFV